MCQFSVFFSFLAKNCKFSTSKKGKFCHKLLLYSGKQIHQVLFNFFVGGQILPHFETAFCQFADIIYSFSQNLSLNPFVDDG